MSATPQATRRLFTFSRGHAGLGQSENRCRFRDAWVTATGYYHAHAACQAFMPSMLVCLARHGFLLESATPFQLAAFFATPPPEKIYSSRHWARQIDLSPLCLLHCFQPFRGHAFFFRLPPINNGGRDKFFSLAFLLLLPSFSGVLLLLWRQIIMPATPFPSYCPSRGTEPFPLDHARFQFIKHVTSCATIFIAAAAAAFFHYAMSEGAAMSCLPDIFRRGGWSCRHKRWVLSPWSLSCLLPFSV